MKKILCFVIVMNLILSLFSFALAKDNTSGSPAEILYELGILKGSGGGISSLSLEKPLTNLNAAIIGLRLRGLEKQASSYEGKNNFSDANSVPWAKTIMSYLYDNPQLTWNSSDNLFNPNQPVSNNAFLKMLIGNLNYKDFTDDEIVSFAAGIGIHSASIKENITVGGASVLVYEALNAKVEGTKTILAEYLVENKVIDRSLADSSSIVEKFDNNILTMAVAWKQTAAEYRALYYQGFNVARERVDEAIKSHKPGDKPLAIVTDVDDTIVTPVNYWGYLIENDIDFFNDEIWDLWIPENKMTPTAGSLDFLNYCKEKGVEVFYVTSRDQGEGTYDYAMGNLKALGFPYADEEHLHVLIETSNKEAVQSEIAEKYNIVVVLGDNLNDFKRLYYVKDVDEREQLMSSDKDLFGSKFILFPNPTDGHWVRAIFGESEPAPGNENRQIWEDAAMKSKWQPK